MIKRLKASALALTMLITVACASTQNSKPSEANKKADMCAFLDAEGGKFAKGFENYIYTSFEVVIESSHSASACSLLDDDNKGYGITDANFYVNGKQVGEAGVLFYFLYEGNKWSLAHSELIYVEDYGLRDLIGKRTGRTL